MLRKNQNAGSQEAFQGKRPYDSDSEKHKLKSKKLAVFIGSSNVPIRLVENAEFRGTLDPRFTVPGRHLIGKKLDLLMIELQGSIQQHLSTARKVSLCADIWSKKGLTSSYLGITAHFFSRKDHRRHRLTLAVRKSVPHPHTGECIRELVDQVLK